jgi:hypothetical protein
MKSNAMFFACIVGGLLLAGAANAQVRTYPDASACNHLDGGALLTCQNQVYTQQMESGVSSMAADPAEVQSSHIEGNEAGQSDFVPGAEGTELPSAYAPITVPSTVYSTLPGPEGTVRLYGPTE